MGDIAEVVTKYVVSDEKDAMINRLQQQHEREEEKIGELRISLEEKENELKAKKKTN